ncbi:MAG TPA: hypothetical protein DEO82_05775 [Eubacterium sp.]|nr:hypothetical protein [Eubacterium sp.]
MKLFKDGLLRANIKRVLLVIIANILISSIVTMLCIATGSYVVGDTNASRLVFAPGMMAGYLFLSFGCYWMSICLFGFLMKRHESDFYGVLPYKRKTMFRKNMATMYGVVALVLAVNMLILVVGSFFVRGHVSVVWEGSFKYIIAAVIAMLLICNVSAFAMSCSGNLRTAFLMTALLLFGPRLLITSVAYAGDLENGVMQIAHFARFLNPDINIMSRAATRFLEIGTAGSIDSMQNISIWAACLYTAVLALIYYVLAERVYIKRDSEIAGTGGIGVASYYFYKIFLGVIIMLIPICNNVTGPDLKNEYGVNAAQVLVFFAISVLAMWFYDAYIGQKGKRFVKLLYSAGAVTACSLIIAGIIYGIKVYEWNYKLDPDKIEGYNINTNYWMVGDSGRYIEDIWVKPDKDTAKRIADAFSRQQKKVYTKDEYGDISYDSPEVITYNSYANSDEHYYGSYNDQYDYIRVKYNGKNVTICVDTLNRYTMDSVYEAFDKSETAKKASYKIPEKVGYYNGMAIGRVYCCESEFLLDSKTYTVFKEEYYKLYDEDKSTDESDFAVRTKRSDVFVLCEELVDGCLRSRTVSINKEDYPKTYSYIWKQYVNDYYDSLEKYVKSIDKNSFITAYDESDARREVKLDITYDQLLEILEAKDEEPKYMYTVVINTRYDEIKMVISSPRELKEVVN